MKTVYYFVHLLNDYSGSPRVLRDVIDSPYFKNKEKYIVTNQRLGFLTGADAAYIKVWYRLSGSQWRKLLYFFLAQLHFFVVMTFALVCARAKRRRTIVVINTLLPFGAAFSSRLFADVVVYYIHETTVNPPQFKPLFRFFVEHCADRVIFVSRYLRERETFRRPLQSIIHNGLRRDFSEVLRVGEAHKFSSKTVLFVGSMKVYKGIYQLLEVARLTPSLRFVGVFNCTQQELRQFSEENELPGNFVPVVSPGDLRSYFEEAFVVLNLSIPDLCVETFALTLLEGMSAGCAVVAPPVGGHTDYVGPEHGLLVDSREVECISEFLNTLASSFERWNRYSRASLETARQLSGQIFQDKIARYFSDVNPVSDGS